MERVRKFIPHIVLTTIYAIVAIIYLVNLNEYNKKLEGLNYFEIIMYENGKTWTYFSMALVLIAIGCFMVYFGVKARYIFEDIIDILIFVGFVIIIIVMCFLIIYYIQNPILRAIFVFFMGGTAYITSQS